MFFVSTCMLLFMANYLIFMASRSILSTIQGYNEYKYMDQNELYISNMDPSSKIDIVKIRNNGTQSVYRYLDDKHIQYAFYTDGFFVPLINEYDVDVSLCYLNKEYYDMRKFDIWKGNDPYFSYVIGDDDYDIEIPVVIGKGLSETYPLETSFCIDEPVLEKTVHFRVVGILKENEYHSNLYALSSKNYYNFSIIVPVNSDFISHSNTDLQLNGLMDLAVFRTSCEQIEDLREIIYSSTGITMNFFNQHDNIGEFNNIMAESIGNIILITSIAVLVLIGISAWNAMVSIHKMIKEFTLNLLVGLSYTKLKFILSVFIHFISIMSTLTMLIITVYNRYYIWMKKDTLFATFGILYLIDLDLISLLVVLIYNLLIGTIIVGIMMWRIKKTPVSIGVLQ